MVPGDGIGPNACWSDLCGWPHDGAGLTWDNGLGDRCGGQPGATGLEITYAGTCPMDLSVPATAPLENQGKASAASLTLFSKL
jgi:hypothetical protein